MKIKLLIICSIFWPRVLPDTDGMTEYWSLHVKEYLSINTVNSTALLH